MVVEASTHHVMSYVALFVIRETPTAFVMIVLHSLRWERVVVDTKHGSTYLTSRSTPDVFVRFGKAHPRTHPPNPGCRPLFSQEISSSRTTLSLWRSKTVVDSIVHGIGEAAFDDRRQPSGSKQSCKGSCIFIWPSGFRAATRA
jgi:hypothetical protein